MRATRWVVAVLLGLHLTAVADPAPDPERQAIAAYQAKDYAAFLAAMRVVAAQDPDVPRVLYNLASAEALGGSPEAAIRQLQRLARTGLSFAIDGDSDFHGLARRAEFRAVVRAMKQNLAPRGKAAPLFTLGERDLLTEGVAYDPDGKTVFVSSIRHRKIIAVDAQGTQRDFIPEAHDGVGGVFGMSVDRTRHVLWATSNHMPYIVGFRPEDKDVAGLVAYDLATGKQLARYGVPRDGKPHVLGEVIVAANGDAYASDSATPTLYRVAAGTHKLEVFLEGGGFASLQGMAMSADSQRLYVADYGRGLFAIDVASRAVTRLAPPPGAALTGIDGLYLHRRRLIATQNGTTPRRVLALDLDGSGTKLTSQRVLLSGDPRTQDMSLAAIVGDELYLNAAAGFEHYNDDGTAKPGPAPAHVILRVPLPR